jgi:hypothetical protein
MVNSFLTARPTGGATVFGLSLHNSVMTDP